MRPKLMSWKDVSKYIYYSDVLIVDLRDSGEYKKGHIRGAWNIPYEELEGRMKQLRGYKRVILYCDYGNQSMEAARTLAADGWEGGQQEAENAAFLAAGRAYLVSPAPESVQEYTPRPKISTSSATIMTLVIFSTPF